MIILKSRFWHYTECLSPSYHQCKAILKDALFKKTGNVLGVPFKIMGNFAFNSMHFPEEDANFFDCEYLRNCTWNWANIICNIVFKKYEEFKLYFYNQSKSNFKISFKLQKICQKVRLCRLCSGKQIIQNKTNCSNVNN